jgi:hypothetical protein
LPLSPKPNLQYADLCWEVWAPSTNNKEEKVALYLTNRVHRNLPRPSKTFLTNRQTHNERTDQDSKTETDGYTYRLARQKQGHKLTKKLAEQDSTKTDNRAGRHTVTDRQTDGQAGWKVGM